MNSEFGDYTIYDANRDISEEAGISLETIEAVVRGEGMWTLCGDDFNRYLSWFMPGKVQAFKDAWKKHMERIPWFDGVLETLSLISSLGRQDLIIGILSVCSELDAPLIRSRTGDFARCFFYSHSMGYMKPDWRIYPLVETVLDIKGEDILYFDDLEPSVTAAAKRGWNAVCTDGTKAGYIREQCSDFLGAELKENAHYRISRLMGQVYFENKAVRMPAAGQF